MDKQFHQLHHEGLLILPNVADADADATGGAAAVWAHGYADGNALLKTNGNA